MEVALSVNDFLDRAVAVYGRRVGIVACNALLEQDGQWRWIDLDATLGDTTFDATHIALSLSALSDGQTYEAMVPMATLIGKLAIRVDSAE